MERAAQFAHPAILGTQCTATMEAHVVERLDRTGVGAHDDELVVGDVVGDVVAGLGDLVGPAHHLPDPPPDLLNLAVVPLAGDEALDIERLGTEILVDVVPKDRRNRSGIVVEVLLNAGARRSRAIRLVRGSLWRHAQVGHQSLLITLVRCRLGLLPVEILDVR